MHIARGEKAIYCVGLVAGLVILFWRAAPVGATPTENRQIRIVPAPKNVKIDGKTGDWDLSGGVFGCPNVQKNRHEAATWVHAMYDSDYLYVLARFRDPHPLNNQRTKAAGRGWNGDCFQLRLKTDRYLHVTAWQDRKGQPVMDIYYGTFSRGGKEGTVPDTLKEGAKMAFQKFEDNNGYFQEIALPWKLLTRSGKPLGAGDTCRITWEGRFDKAWKVGDLYAPKPDRIFTFRATGSWGKGIFTKKNNLEPAPVRLADGREFPVKMKDGRPVVDWAGLIEEKRLPGHIPISFELKEEGYVTIAIHDEKGNRIRNLVSDRHFTAGQHTVMWDGLKDKPGLDPGKPMEPGTYEWKGLVHDNLHLVYRGVYHNAGTPPWNNFEKDSDWGGDHGVPIAAATAGDRVILGWSGGEASTQLIAVNPDNYHKIWGVRRGYASTELLTVDGNDVYAGPHGMNVFHARVDDGSLAAFSATGTADLPIPKLGGAKKPVRPADTVAIDGKLYMSFSAQNVLARVDIKSGKLEKEFTVKSPGRMGKTADGSILVISEDKILRWNPEDGNAKQVISGLDAPKGITCGPDGKIYVALWGETHQVHIFTPDGKLIRKIGKKGGRASLGPWDAEALLRPIGLTVGPKGRLWIGERVDKPKRWSVWTTDGELLRELFGSSHYGADGGALKPDDPYVGVGQMCEWRVNPKTGRDECLGKIAADSMVNVQFPLERTHSSRYVKANGRWYLAQGLHRYFSMLKVYRRGGPGDFKLVAVVGNARQRFSAHRGKRLMPFSKHALFADRTDSEVFSWADRNGDGDVQKEELSFRDIGTRMRGAWQHLGVNGSLTAYFPMKDGTIWEFPVSGYTKTEAPKYDLSAAHPIPDAHYGGGQGSVLPSLDGEVVMSHSNPLKSFDADSGNLLWTYPNTWAGVHGSHRAPEGEPGLLRGTFAFVGSAKTKGDEEVFVVNSNVGEWHAFTRDGLYVANLFTADPARVNWPEKAEPGVLMDDCPPGMGGEDFGGFFTGTTDGRAFIQAGKTGFWIIELTGLNSIRRLDGGPLKQTEAGVARSRNFYSRRKQKLAGVKKTDVHRVSPKVDGELDEWEKAWFAGYYVHRRGGPRIETALGWDQENLYLACRVNDRSGTWKNNANLPENLYSRGDTVDLQLGTNPDANPKRRSAAKGDLRLAIGKVKGEPAAVIYREKGPVGNGKSVVYSSGVIHHFEVKSVQTVDEARIAVSTKRRSYVVEAAVPLDVLGLTPRPGLTIRGDFGVTFSNRAGTDVVRRKYWSNRNTGIVNDEVFELKLEPRNWGELTFEK
ncbi:MAG: sugar-binding protein [Candidatus Brocadiia bacterium]